MPFQGLKPQLKRIKHRIALVLKQHPLAYDVTKYFSRTWDRNRQYHFLLDIFRVSKAITILQVGANDGMRDDPIREFIVFNPKCTAWLVEPIPAMQKALHFNYRREIKQNRVKILPYAISQNQASLALFQVKSSYADELPDYAKGMISSSPSHLLNRSDLNIAKDSIEELRIQAITPIELANIVNNHVDLMIIDIEGMEEEFMRNFPWHQCRPDFILYESYHLGSQSQHEINSFLAGQGYSTCGLGKDTAVAKKGWLLQAKSINPNIFNAVGRFI